MKKCIKCNLEKEQYKFYKSRTECKKCQNKRRNDRRMKDPNKEWERQRQYKMKKKYGITNEDYLILLNRQNSKCAICNNEEKTNCSSTRLEPRKLAVDHNHSTGKVRELLCTKCNTVLGKVNEDIEILKSMIAYLEKHK